MSIDAKNTNLQIHKSLAGVFKEPRRHVYEDSWPPVDFLELCLLHLSKQEQVFDHMWMKLAGRYQGRDHPIEVIEERHQVEGQFAPALSLAS